MLQMVIPATHSQYVFSNLQGYSNARPSLSLRGGALSTGALGMRNLQLFVHPASRAAFQVTAVIGPEGIGVDRNSGCTYIRDRGT